QAICSVSRGGLNEILITAAETYPNVKVYFNHKCVDLDPKTGQVEFEDTTTGRRVTAANDAVIGADGAFSAVRRRLQGMDHFDYSQSYLEHGYKELNIPPSATAEGGFAMHRSALHIWPRRSYMMIALPNADGSFTCTLFWPFKGPHGFEQLKTREQTIAYFKE